MGEDSRVLVLHGEGCSIREIARRTGLSRMKVHRIVASAPAAPEKPSESDGFGGLRSVPAGSDFNDDDDLSPADTEVFAGAGNNSDPLLTSLLSVSDMELLGVTAEDLAGLRGDAMVVYRLVGDGSGSSVRWDGAAAVKARASLSGREWALWLVKQAGGEVQEEFLGPGGPVANDLRDARIVELRRSGWTLAAIAEEVGLSGKAAVHNALARIAAELKGPESAGPRLHRRPKPSEEW